MEFFDIPTNRHHFIEARAVVEFQGWNEPARIHRYVRLAQVLTVQNIDFDGGNREAFFG